MTPSLNKQNDSVWRESKAKAIAQCDMLAKHTRARTTPVSRRWSSRNTTVRRTFRYLKAQCVAELTTAYQVGSKLVRGPSARKILRLLRRWSQGLVTLGSCLEAGSSETRDRSIANQRIRTGARSTCSIWGIEHALHAHPSTRQCVVSVKLPNVGSSER